MAIYTFTYNKLVDGPGVPSNQQINLNLGSYKNIQGVRVTCLGNRDTNPDQNVTYALRYVEPDYYLHAIFVEARLPGTVYKETIPGNWNVNTFRMECFDSWVSVHTDCYWVSFKVELSESGDFPPEELIPGQRFCMDGHLYEVGADGASWFLIEANAEICAVPGVCPDFWVDPVGAVVCWILNAFEAALGLMAGGFYLLQQNMASFIDGFGAAIVAFLDDPVTQIQTWMSDIFVTLSFLTTEMTTFINAWWTGVVDTIGGWWSSTWADIAAFWSDLTTHIGSWWDGLVASTGAWIAATWTNIQTFWSDVTIHIENWWSGVQHDFGTWVSNTWEGVVTFWEDVQNHFGTWWDSVRSDVGEWWNSTTEAVVNGWNDFIAGVGEAWNTLLFGLNLIIDTQVIMIQTWLESWIPEEIGKMFTLPEWLTAPFTAIGQFAQAIIDMLAGTYPKEKKIQDAEDAAKEHQKEIDRILGEI